MGLAERRFFAEGLTGPASALAQTARRWTRLPVAAFAAGQKQEWLALVKAIEQQLVLARAHPGQLAGQGEYLFRRTGGHIGSLMTLITRGCYKAVRTGSEALTRDLLDTVRIDEASEQARRPRAKVAA